MQRNQMFMGRFLKEPSSDPYQQLTLLNKDQLAKEALSCVTELYRDKALTRYQILLISLAIKASPTLPKEVEECLTRPSERTLCYGEVFC